MSTFARTAWVLLILAAAGAILPPDAVGQGVPGSGLGRPYWHVFAAYAIAWVLVFGWVVSIARRLARIEKRLGD